MTALGGVGFLWLLGSGLIAIMFIGESRKPEYERVPFLGQILLVTCWPILIAMLLLFSAGCAALLVLMGEPLRKPR